MAGAKSFQEQIDDLASAFRTLTDRKWEWHRDPKAIALLLYRLGLLLLLALSYATAAGVLPQLEDGSEAAEPAEVIDVEAVEAERSVEP